MPKALVIVTWPESMREELNRRLRATAYTDLGALAAWATERGFSVSRSSLHRYAVRLRRLDAAGGDPVALMALQTKKWTQKALRIPRADSNRAKLGQTLDRLDECAAGLRARLSEVAPREAAEAQPMAQLVCDLVALARKQNGARTMSRSATTARTKVAG